MAAAAVSSFRRIFVLTFVRQSESHWITGAHLRVRSKNLIITLNASFDSGTSAL